MIISYMVQGTGYIHPLDKQSLDGFGSGIALYDLFWNNEYNESNDAPLNSQSIIIG